MVFADASESCALMSLQCMPEAVEKVAGTRMAASLGIPHA